MSSTLHLRDNECVMILMSLCGNPSNQMFKFTILHSQFFSFFSMCLEIPNRLICLITQTKQPSHYKWLRVQFNRNQIKPIRFDGKQNKGNWFNSFFSHSPSVYVTRLSLLLSGRTHLKQMNRFFIIITVKNPNNFIFWFHTRRAHTHFLRCDWFLVTASTSSSLKCNQNRLFIYRYAVFYCTRTKQKYSQINYKMWDGKWKV